MFMLDLQAVYLNISGYRFTQVENVSATLDCIEDFCSELDVKGSIFVAMEGINISLAGNILAIQTFISKLNEDTRFANIRFHQTYSKNIPFNKLIFKIKNELVPLGKSPFNSESFTHQYLPAKKLQQWLDEGKDITLLDMRNEFEFELGTFEGAQHLHLNGFRQLPSKHEAINCIPKDKPVVTFCTGGIRCEKAGPYMENLGFNEVYQLDGGIIEYLRQTKGRHWQGNCFVFDDRISLDKNLKSEHCNLCLVCQKMLSESEHQVCSKCMDAGVLPNATV